MAGFGPMKLASMAPEKSASMTSVPELNVEVSSVVLAPSASCEQTGVDADDRGSVGHVREVAEPQGDLFGGAPPSRPAPPRCRRGRTSDVVRRAGVGVVHRRRVGRCGVGGRRRVVVAATGGGTDGEQSGEREGEGESGTSDSHGRGTYNVDCTSTTWKPD